MSENVVIYHNPRCSKSRQTLEILKEHGVEPEIVEYLKTPPSVEELDVILKKLDKDPTEVMRPGEEDYKELGIKDGGFSREELITMMVEHPKIIERPIVVCGNKAAIGRPPESVLDIVN